MAPLRLFDTQRASEPPGRVPGELAERIGVIPELFSQKYSSRGNGHAVTQVLEFEEGIQCGVGAREVP